jgi:hypothetical protein
MMAVFLITSRTESCCEPDLCSTTRNPMLVVAAAVIGLITFPLL